MARMVFLSKFFRSLYHSLRPLHALPPYLGWARGRATSFICLNFLSAPRPPCPSTQARHESEPRHFSVYISSVLPHPVACSLAKLGKRPSRVVYLFIFPLCLPLYPG
jgi:hypothetical protein